MNQRKLGGIVRRIRGLYGSSRKPRLLESVAGVLGRKRVKHGAYSWESKVFPSLPPVSHEEVVRVFTENNEKLRKLLFEIVPAIPAERNCVCARALSDARSQI